LYFYKNVAKIYYRYKERGINMEVNSIPVPAIATIRVSKEDKSAVFETTIIQTTDNKYIYALPVKLDGKSVNFETKGLFKEIKVEIAPFEFYEWRNVSIIKFKEKGSSFLRIRTTTPGIKALAWTEKPMKTLKKEKKSVIVDTIPVSDEQTETVATQGAAVAET
jgi:hypothetical protein